MNTVIDLDGEHLFSVQINNAGYTALDIFYTISQKYTLVAADSTTYINKSYPPKVSLIAPDAGLWEMYFCPDGKFLFSGEQKPNPHRAATEFINLVGDKKLIMAPSITKYFSEADCVKIKNENSGSTIYFYKDLQ